MDILVRGKYVIADLEAGEDGVITDGATLLSDGKVIEVGDYDALKKKTPRSRREGRRKTASHAGTHRRTLPRLGPDHDAAGSPGGLSRKRAARLGLHDGLGA